MNRAVDLFQGTAYVVTDLHGEWEPYVRYRDHFLTLRRQGVADKLIFLGDIIHGYGSAEQDYSLPILWDIMRLRAWLGPHVVIMLLGNHELPHIYGVTLAKGDLSFTPRFEHALGEYRLQVMQFLKGLPFFVRTSGGTMLTHAGAAITTAVPDTAQRLLEFSHDELLAEADRLMASQDVIALLQSTVNLTPVQYDQMARTYLAVTGPNDPRYYDLLRGFVVSNIEPEWSSLWDLLFSQCELGLVPGVYQKVLSRFLEAYSPPGIPQRVLVSGHMVVDNGSAIVDDYQLRLASWAHAVPKESGSYLLFDVAKPVHSAADLAQFVHRMP